MTRLDPGVVMLFKLDLGIAGEATFLECSGLSSTTQVVDYPEGGENNFVHKLLGTTTYANLVLRLGVTKGSAALWEWRQAIKNHRKAQMRDCSIILYDDAGQEIMRYLVHNAFPVKWEGPALKGGDNQIAIETLELAYEYLVMHPKKG